MFMTLVYGCKIWNKKINNLAYEVFMSILENKALFYGLLSTPNVKKGLPFSLVPFFRTIPNSTLYHGRKITTHTLQGVSLN